MREREREEKRERQEENTSRVHLPFSLLWLGNPRTSDHVTLLPHLAATSSGIEQPPGLLEGSVSSTAAR